MKHYEADVRLRVYFDGPDELTTEDTEYLAVMAVTDNQILAVDVEWVDEGTE